MTDDLRASIALLAVRELGVSRFWKLIGRFGGPAALLRTPIEALLAAGVRDALARAVLAADPQDAAPILGRTAAAGARAVSFFDSDYPGALRFIFDPPPVLYVLGELIPADVEAVAIVGSRTATGYGLDAARGIAADLARRGVTVVSGLARGIDTAAHRAALDAGGRTLAVLGSGVDWIYPVRNRKLAVEIRSAGAILSELPPGTHPQAAHFPRRNRIVSGLSQAVVVVEAGAASGSLITARLAAEQGREVCAVPGRIRSPETRGTHRLLREGAALVESGDDVIAAAFPWRSADAPASAPRAEGLLAHLPHSGSRRHVDELAAETGFPVDRLLEELLDLELRGLIVRHPGMQFARRP